MIHIKGISDWLEMCKGIISAYILIKSTCMKFYSMLHKKHYGSTTLTLSQTSPGFYMSEGEVFWKTLWEKEKLLVTSNFSFSHCVFYLVGELSAILITFEFVTCKLFQFGSI